MPLLRIIFSLTLASAELSCSDQDSSRPDDLHNPRPIEVDTEDTAQIPEPVKVEPSPATTPLYIPESDSEEKVSTPVNAEKSENILPVESKQHHVLHDGVKYAVEISDDKIQIINRPTEFQVVLNSTLAESEGLKLLPSGSNLQERCSHPDNVGRPELRHLIRAIRIQLKDYIDTQSFIDAFLESAMRQFQNTNLKMERQPPAKIWFSLKKQALSNQSPRLKMHWENFKNSKDSERIVEDGTLGTRVSVAMLCDFVLSNVTAILVW